MPSGAATAAHGKRVGKAARGTDGRLYPWGNTYDHTFVAWDQTYARGSAPADPESPYGCHDMAGGAWEWTADWYQPYPGNPIPCEAYGEKYKVMRGGASFNDYAHMRTTHRYYLPTNTTGKLLHRIPFACKM
jgi:formylglycine-generating enzyme required for sulfatase activity